MAGACGAAVTARFHTIGPLRIEAVEWNGETRYRFWHRAFWHPGWVLSDGGMYTGIQQALEAGRESLEAFGFDAAPARGGEERGA